MVDMEPLPSERTYCELRESYTGAHSPCNSSEPLPQLNHLLNTELLSPQPGFRLCVDSGTRIHLRQVVAERLALLPKAYACEAQERGNVRDKRRRSRLQQHDRGVDLR